MIENMAGENDIDLAVSDKFGRPDFIERALMEKGRKIKLIQEVKAESITQVAAASILARAGFINYMNRLANQYRVKLPKGAGKIVDEAAAAMVREQGPEILHKIAKVHFKNYRRVVQ